MSRQRPLENKTILSKWDHHEAVFSKSFRKVLSKQGKRQRPKKPKKCPACGKPYWQRIEPAVFGCDSCGFHANYNTNTFSRFTGRTDKLATPRAEHAKAEEMTPRSLVSGKSRKTMPPGIVTDGSRDQGHVAILTRTRLPAMIPATNRGESPNPASSGVHSDHPADCQPRLAATVSADTSESVG